MPFFKTASIPIVGIYQSSGKFHKLASKHADIGDEDEKLINRSLNLVSDGVLKAMAKVYNISDDINNYIFPVPRAVTADISNNNGDVFTHEELTRFSPVHRCQVYKTFKNDPIHIEHMASDPKSARGFIPDVYYVTAVPDDKHVLCVAAIDASKDMPLAEGLVSGDITDFSMGCICDAVKCRICGSVAYSDNDLCEHLMWHKMSHINGKLVCEECLGVEFQELSQVGEGADPRAKNQAILQYNARLQKIAEAKQGFSPIASLLPKDDQVEAAEYFRKNMNKLPGSVVRLANKLF
jgi:hypothetical protein